MENQMFSRIAVSGLCLGLVWGTGASVAAAPLAQESFNYSAGIPISEANAGTGWSNGWVDVSGNAGEFIRSGNLAAGAFAPAGFDARSSGNSVYINSNSRGGRWLDCSPGGVFAQAGLLDTNGHIGAHGRTVYLSFLQQPGSAAQFYEFEFHRGSLGDAGRVAGIGNDVGDAEVHWRNEIPAGGSSTFWDLGAGSTNVNFYVVRIDFLAGNDDVYVYRNPTESVETNNDPMLTLSGAGDLSFDGIAMAAYLNGVTVANDEIRVGQTWADVLGDPPVFILEPTNQAGYLGQGVTLTALAESDLPLIYQWYQGAQALAGQTNSSLTLSGLPSVAAGIYSVTASNALGVATSTLATVTVQAISATVSGPSTVVVGAGSNLVLKAVAGGDQPLTLQWYQNGVAISDATNATYAAGGANVFAAGQYVLVASNAYGSVTSAIVNVVPNLGGLLAYEGFNYGSSASDIGGAKGGLGWAGGWVNVAGSNSQSYATTLLARTNAPPGYDAHSLAGYLFQPNASRKGRYLDCSATGPFALHGLLDSHGNIGADGSTIYLSFLQQASSTSPFYEFELKRGDLGDAGRIGGIGNDTGSGNTDANLRIESPAGGNSTFYPLGQGSTKVNFYVLRIDYHTGDNTVTVYRNPSSLTEPSRPTLSVSNVADLSFNGLSFAAYLNNVTVAHDEVRLGLTYADVLGDTVSQLRLAQWTNHTSSLLLAASPDYTYQLQGATNVSGPWTNLGDIAVPALGIGQFLETNATSSPQFYRATNPAAWSPLPSNDLVLADFEEATYGSWTTTGTAFGTGPAFGTLASQQTVSGYDGSGLVDSYLGGDTSTGTLTSPPFAITKPYLNFLIGGGDYPGQEGMNLLISNVVVATATGADSETLRPQQWNVSAYLGQTATLQIVDAATGSWGHILVDEIALSDTAFPALSRTLWLTNNLLDLPVKNGATLRRVTVTVGGSPVRDFNIELADGTPDWWAFVDVSAYQGQTATISVNALNAGSTGLSAIVSTNGIVGATNLYQETLRPQLHFSTRRGWLNDANGMFYHQGQYHLYYQHDPFNWDGSGQKWWGHAVSPDMVNWQELPEGIYSHAYGDDVWSGSAVVDTANTSGLKTGTNDVIVAAYYSTARGECLAYSNDGGLSFTDYAANPVVVQVGRDPHLLWYAPSNHWVLAVYDATGGNGVSFYSSPNLREWSFQSKIYNGFYECPDLFPLPVDGNTNNLVWELNDASGGYMLGQFNGSAFTPTTAELPGNLGSGFYASQTFTSMKPADARKVRIGWAQIATPGMPFNQLMYFPTELTLQTTANGVRLCSTPIVEITNHAEFVYHWTNLTLNVGDNPLGGIRGSLFDVQAQFSVGSAQSISFSFQNVTVTYRAATQQISCNGDTQSLPPLNGIVQVEIVVDRDTIEIFGNHGQLYLPLPAGNATGDRLISLTASGGSASFVSLTVNKLKSIWTGLGN